MHTRAGVVLCVALALSAAVASADTFYKYRNKSTGREVFVNRLDQVPHKYRDEAKVVLDAKTSAEPAEAPSEEVFELPAKPTRRAAHVPIPASDMGAELRQALSGKNLLRDGPALASAAIDARLVTAGTRPLTGAERDDLSDLIIAIVIAFIVAGLAALAAFIVIIVTAVRDNRPWWALLSFLFWPLAYLYLFLHAGKGRALFKSLCSLAMLSPALVGLVGAWRFHAWFQAIVQIRGGRM
jgi:hypothetical protein